MSGIYFHYLSDVCYYFIWVIQLRTFGFFSPSLQTWIATVVGARKGIVYFNTSGRKGSGLRSTTKKENYNDMTFSCKLKREINSRGILRNNPRWELDVNWSFNFVIYIINSQMLLLKGRTAHLALIFNRYQKQFRLLAIIWTVIFLLSREG